MGGEYISDWKIGSHLRWKGLNGQLLTNGVILKIELEKLLQHSLLNLGASSDDDVMAVLTYELQERDGSTDINIREDFTNPITEKEYTDPLEGWKGALQAVKEIMEK